MGMTRRLRILFVIPTMTGGGSEKVLLLLLRSIDRSRFEPLVVTTKGGGVLMEDIPSDVALYNLGGSRSRYTVFQLMHKIWTLKPDVILSMAIHITILLAVMQPMLPHGTRLIARQNVNTSAYVEYEVGCIWRWLIRVFYPKVDLIICQTDEMLVDLRDNFHVDRRRLVRIYNPVDRRSIEAAANGPSPYCGIGPHLVCAGRLHSQKGFDLLIRAIGLLRDRALQVQLTILGEGEEKEMLEQLAEDLGIGSSVRFPGFQANPYSYFKNADAFVLSSRYEGLSNAMLEAASLATPIVAIDIPGGVAEVLRGSNAAWIATKADADDIANAIAEFLRQLPRVRSSVVRHPMIEEMDCERIVGQYEEVLSQCVLA